MLTELVDVQPYHWSTLPPCGFFEVLGKRGTGKTTWTQHILQSSPHKSSGLFVVMAGSETAKQVGAAGIFCTHMNNPRITPPVCHMYDVPMSRSLFGHCLTSILTPPW